MSYRLRECPLCAGREFVPLLRARDYHYGNPGEYGQAQCTQCSLAVLDPMYEEEELAEFYPNDYYAFADQFSDADSRPSLGKRFWKLLGFGQHRTKDPQFAAPGRMLDIGCGSGFFLAEMRDQGWEVKGVEPNAAAAEYGRSKEGLDIFPGSLMEANFPTESFDYVRLNHSFEHMANPNEILDEIFRILSDQGKLMIGVPNRDGLAARVFKQFWYHLALPVHTIGYSVKTLSRMLEKHHFKIERVVYNTDLTPVLCGVQIYLNRNDAAPSFHGRFTGSRLTRLLCCWAAHAQNALGVADVIEMTATKQ